MSTKIFTIIMTIFSSQLTIPTENNKHPIIFSGNIDSRFEISYVKLSCLNKNEYIDGYFFKKATDIMCICGKNTKNKLFHLYFEDSTPKVLCFKCLCDKKKFDILNNDEMHWAYTLLSVKDSNEFNTSKSILFFNLKKIWDLTNSEFAYFNIFVDNIIMYHNKNYFDMLGAFINTNFYNTQVKYPFFEFKRDYEKTLDINIIENLDSFNYSLSSLGGYNTLDKISNRTTLQMIKRIKNRSKRIINTVVIEMKFRYKKINFIIIENVKLENQYKIMSDIDEIVIPFLGKSGTIKAILKIQYDKNFNRSKKTILILHITTCNPEICLKNYIKIFEILIIYLFFNDKRVSNYYSFNNIKSELQIATFLYLILDHIHRICNIKISSCICHWEDFVKYKKYKELANLSKYFYSKDILQKDKFFDLMRAFVSTYQIYLKKKQINNDMH